MIQFSPQVKISLQIGKFCPFPLPINHTDAWYSYFWTPLKMGFNFRKSSPELIVMEPKNLLVYPNWVILLADYIIDFFFSESNTEIMELLKRVHIEKCQFILPNYWKIREIIYWILVYWLNLYLIYRNIHKLIFNILLFVIRFNWISSTFYLKKKKKLNKKVLVIEANSLNHST